MNSDKETSRDSFDTARNQRAHNLENISDAAREKLAEIHAASERERAAMREAHAESKVRDTVTEKARLLRERPTPRYTPTGLAEERTSKPLTNEELTQKALRNVEQTNERQLRSTYLREDVTVEAVIARDVEGPASERPKAKDDTSLSFEFYRSSIDRDGGRER